MWPLVRTPGPLGRTWGAATAAFTPDAISGLVLWLAADAITSLADNDPVATWADLSTAGNDMTSSGTARPTYKTGILNGLPVVRLDGSTDYMSTPSGITLRSIFVVSRFGIAGTYTDYLSLLGRQTPSFHVTTFDPGSTVLSAYSTHTHNHMYRNTVLTNDNAPIDSWSVLAFMATADEGPDTWDLGRNDQSGTRLWNGDYAEVIAYDSALSDTDRGLVETYLNTKYAIY